MNPNDVLTHAMQAYRSKEEPERLYALAGKYWRIMRSVAVIICILAIAAGAYMLVITFFNIGINKSSASAPKNLNRSQLTQAVAGFAARKELFIMLQTGSSTVADPSK